MKPKRPSRHVRIDGDVAQAVEARRDAIREATGVDAPTSSVVSSLVRLGLAHAPALALAAPGSTTL